MSLTFSGCWDYLSITDINIISGVAVDMVPETGEYLLTFEIVNVSNGPEGVAKSIYSTAEGFTMFEAVRNAKKKLANQFYFGNMQLLVINQEIAENIGISMILDALLRDGEPRETVSIIVSKEEDAKSILLEKRLDTTSVSYELNDMIEYDSKITVATKNVHIFQAYNYLNETGKSLILPAVKFSQRKKSVEIRGSEEGNNESKDESEGGEDEPKIVELGGIALMPNDRLVGYLSADETNYFLIAVNDIKGGSFNFGLEPNTNNDMSLEIRKSRTSHKFTYRDGRLKIHFKIKNNMNLIEMKKPLDILAKDVRERIEKRSAEELTKRIEAVIYKAQNEFKSDIFSFGNMLYKSDPKLWSQLEADWNNHFCNAEIEIEAETKLINTGITLYTAQ